MISRDYILIAHRTDMSYTYSVCIHIHTHVTGDSRELDKSWQSLCITSYLSILRDSILVSQSI